VTESKRCTKCGEEKPLEEFNKDRCAHDGLYSWCKPCKKESRRRHYEENLEQFTESRRRRYGENRERELDGVRKYHEENREQVLAGHRRYIHCVNNPACPAVGGRGAEFIIFTCGVCGKEFRRLKAAVDWRYEHEGRLPQFCSRSCTDASKRKDYKSPYARNIERIKKAVGA